MLNTFFGGAEPDGRRHLGSDLALLGKWVAAATLAPPSPQIALSELSKQDQEKLFTSPRLQYAFAYQRDGSLKLQEIKAGKERELDPDVRAMLSQDKYKLIQEREAARRRLLKDHETKKRIQERHDMARRAFEDDGNDDYDAFVRSRNIGVRDDEKANRIRRATENQRFETTDSYSKDQFTLYERADKHIEMKSLDSVRDSYALPTRRSNRDPSKRNITPKAEPADGASVYPNFYSTFGARLAKKGSDDIPSSLDDKSNHQAFCPTQASFPSLIPYAALQFPSQSASPDHGSDTTNFNGSPEYFSDATLPSRRLSQNSYSSVDSVFDSQGGAGLDATAPTFDPAASSIWAPPRGGLGTGLSEAYISGDFSNKSQSMPTGFQHPFLHHVPAQQQVSSADLVSYFGPPSAAASAVSALYGTPGVPRPVFAHAEAFFPAPQPKFPAFSVSKAQPYPGITFYDVPGRRPDDALAPAYWTTKEGKARLLDLKLQKLKDMDAKMLENPATKVPASNIHVFVDMSNIIIGFYDSLKRKRGLSAEKRIKAPRFSFDNFHALLARGRKVKKSVVAGSRTSTGTQKTPEYMRQAENLGYEMNIMRRIPKEKDCKSEQGVDEILHLKILQCPYDHDDGTIVLATGDAAEAEFSDGFKKQAERVLKCGWNLELYAWSHTISSAWRDTAFLAKHGDRIRIIELDEFIEELYEMSIDML